MGRLRRPERFLFRLTPLGASKMLTALRKGKVNGLSSLHKGDCKGRISVGMSRQRRAGSKFVLLIVLALSLCMPICDLADHHGSSATYLSLCMIDMPQVYQLLIMMNSLFLAMLTGTMIPPAPTFSLLKPPRFVPPYLTAR